MKSTAGIALGVLLIGAGAAALIAINVRLVPLLVNRPSALEHPTAERLLPPVRVEAIDDAGRAPEAAAAPAITDAGVAEPDAAAVRVVDAGDAVADAASGAPAFQPIEFEPKGSIPAPAAIDIVRGLAAYLKSHFEMRVLLEGHGDADATPHEYLTLGSARSRAVMRMLIDNGVSAGRIGLEPPKGNVQVQGAVGTVRLKVEPRFAEQKGKRNVP